MSSSTHHPGGGDETPPALEDHQENHWDLSSHHHHHSPSRTIITATSSPSVYVSACSSIRASPPSRHHASFTGDTPRRRAPSPINEASTPALGVHSPIPLATHSTHRDRPPLPPTTYSSQPRHPSSPSPAPSTSISDLRTSLNHLRERASGLAKEVNKATHPPPPSAAASPRLATHDDDDDRYNSIKLLAAHSQLYRSPQHCRPVAGGGSCAGGVQTPHPAVRSSRSDPSKDRAPSLPSPQGGGGGPSGLELLELEHASLCRKLDTIHSKMVECDQFAARYRMHALDMEGSWQEEEDRLQRRQEDLIQQLVERGIPIPSIRYANDDDNL